MFYPRPAGPGPFRASCCLPTGRTAPSWPSTSTANSSRPGTWRAARWCARSIPPTSARSQTWSSAPTAGCWPSSTAKVRCESGMSTGRHPWLRRTGCPIPSSASGSWASRHPDPHGGRDPERRALPAGSSTEPLCQLPVHDAPSGAKRSRRTERTRLERTTHLGEVTAHQQGRRRDLVTPHAERADVRQGVSLGADRDVLI